MMRSLIFQPGRHPGMGKIALPPIHNVFLCLATKKPEDLAMTKSDWLGWGFGTLAASIDSRFFWLESRLGLCTWRTLQRWIRNIAGKSLFLNPLAVHFFFVNRCSGTWFFFSGDVWNIRGPRHRHSRPSPRHHQTQPLDPMDSNGWIIP